MPVLAKKKAAERLAQAVETAKPSALDEFYSEIFPDSPATAPLSATELARYVRSDLLAEEIVDLWNVVFPTDRNVWYDEEDDKIHYNEETPGYAETD
jgi:hypothetical protein